MKEKIKTFLNQYFWLIFMIWLWIIFVVVFSLQSSCENTSFNKGVTDQNIEAGKAENEASNANTNAANFDVNRRTEDVIRAKTIAPKLEKARQNSQNSKIELEKARKTYNEKKNSTDNPSNSDADNCFELERLFANVRFDGCPDN